MTAFKKPLCAILSLVLTFCLIVAVPLTALAADEEPLYSAKEIELNKEVDENGFEYIKVDENSAIEIVGYVGTETEISVPTKISGLSVVSIGASAFEGNETVQIIDLHSDITSVGEKAFKDCTALKEVEDTKSLDTIGVSAFEGCIAMESFELPDNVTAVPERCFFGATALAEVEAHNNLKSVAKDAFTGTKWENEKEDGPLNFGRVLYSFKGTVKDVVIPEGVSIIEDYVFIGNDSMETLTLGFDVEEIGEYAFQNCVNLKTVTTNEALGVIAAGTFKGCVSLESIDLSETTVATIGYQAFSDCVSLAEIKLSETLSEIGEYAFQGTAITSIEFLKNVNSVSANAFLNAETLENISVVDNNKEFTSIDGVLYNKKVKALICVPAAISGEFTLPASVEEIRDEAFYGSNVTEVKLADESALKYIGISAFENSSIESVIIPAKIEKLNANTFKNATKLSNVTFEEGITYIGAGAFEGAVALEEIKLPESLVKVGNSAFKNAGLKSVNTGDGLAEISSNAFADNKALTDLYIGKNVEKIGENAFANAKSLVAVNLPASLIYFNANAFVGNGKLAKVTVDKDSKYFKAVGNSVYSADGKTLAFVSDAKATTVAIANGTEAIGFNAFVNAPKVSEITFPATLKTIEFKALDETVWFEAQSGAVYAGPVFYRDKGITGKFAVNAGTTAIAESAFQNSKLTNITLPGSLVEIGKGAFYNSALTSIAIPDSVTEIGSDAFGACKDLKSVKLSKSISEIKTATFMHCESLERIDVPESVKVISTDAFADCKSLKFAVIPAVEEIEQYAFADCVALAQITLPKTLISFDPVAFTGCSALATVNVEEGNAKYKSFDMYVYVANDEPAEDGTPVFETIALCAPGTKDGVMIPADVKRIGYRAFYNCDGITKIGFHDKFEDIVDEAFFDCDNIEMVEMPESARKIGKHAFASCDNLRTFIVNSNLTDYEDNAFEGCYYMSYDGVTINVEDSSWVILVGVALVFVIIGVIWYLVYNKKQKKIQAEIIEKARIKEALEAQGE